MNALIHLLLGVTLLASSITERALAQDGELVVFTRSSDAPATASWSKAGAGELEALANRLDCSLRHVDVSKDGAPVEVAITPLLVFQNHRGRSIYQGRSTNLDRIENFIRTSRLIPQSSEPWIRERVPVRECGRASIAAPLKVTELSGVLPEGHDAETFQGEARAAILEGLGSFQERAQVEFGRSDRTFYFDFYPYRSESNELFLSLALFSQFHCKEPIFVSEESLRGSFDDRASVFARGAKELEAATLKLMAESTVGDAFDCLPATIRECTWEDLNLELPAAPESDTSAVAAIELPAQWLVGPARDGGAPRVLFRFPPPLDGTSGEIKELSGELTLGKGTVLPGARGKLVVEVDSLTMGFEDLDQVVKSVVMLDVKSHPEASFTLEKVLSSEGRLEFGSQSRAVVSGQFEMKGKSLPIEVSSIWEPVVDEQGSPRLLVNGAFSIRLLEPFGIKGPDGPSPQRDTLQFFFALELLPAKSR